MYNLLFRSIFEH